MTSGSDEVRRLSTLNSVLEPDFVHTTDWLWYWEDEHGKWYEYAAVSSEHHMTSITSQQLEEMNVKKEKDVVEFSAGSHQYSLSFQDMIQTNLKYGTKRLVRRRPRFVSAAEVQTARKRPTNSTSIPDYWDKTQIPKIGYKRVGLQPYTDEYQEIQALFSQTMANFKIIQIERIQNKALWEAFRLQNVHMKNNNGRKPVLEKKLFHGTNPKFVDTICATNFDWRVCGVNGTSYGQGSYFARDASYSHRYTGTTEPRFMFVSRVLVGEFTVGSSEYRRPPSKDGGDVNLFDSCVNRVENPSIFVVFEKHQIYPEYLLQYEQNSLHDMAKQRLIEQSNAQTLSYNSAIVDSASAPNPMPTLATSKPLISYPKPKLQAGEDRTDLTRGLASWRTNAPEKPKSFPYDNTGIDNSYSAPSPINMKSTRLIRRVIPQPERKTIGYTSSIDNPLETPIPATVPRPTLMPTTKPLIAPKPVVIPSCFTSQTPKSSRLVVSSSRSSTPASRAYTLDYLKKL